MEKGANYLDGHNDDALPMLQKNIGFVSRVQHTFGYFEMFTVNTY